MSVKVSGLDLSTVHAVPEIRQDVRDPTPDDDLSTRCGVGDEWYNTETGAVFKCIDSTEGSAVWSNFIAATRGAERQAEREGEHREGDRQTAQHGTAQHGNSRSVPRHQEPVTRPGDA